MSARRAARGQHAAATPRIITLNLAWRSGGHPSRSAGRALAPRPVKLGALFEMEYAPVSPPPQPQEEEEEEDRGEHEQEKWRFQAEILRAEYKIDTNDAVLEEMKKAYMVGLRLIDSTRRGPRCGSPGSGRLCQNQRKRRPDSNFIVSFLLLLFTLCCNITFRVENLSVSSTP